MSPEVLIYVQNVKKYFTTNEEAQKYFENLNNENEFFKCIGEMAQKNFEEHGDPALSFEQFEDLRKKITKTFNTIGLFISMGEYGHISLN
jgi:hypothetical protein